MSNYGAIGMHRTSFELNTGMGTLDVTICACGVICFAPMAHIHAHQCPVYLLETMKDGCPLC